MKSILALTFAIAGAGAGAVSRRDPPTYNGSESSDDTRTGTFTLSEFYFGGQAGSAPYQVYRFLVASSDGSDTRCRHVDGSYTDRNIMSFAATPCTDPSYTFELSRTFLSTQGNSFILQVRKQAEGFEEIGCAVFGEADVITVQDPYRPGSSYQYVQSANEFTIDWDDSGCSFAI